VLKQELLHALPMGDDDNATGVHIEIHFGPQTHRLRDGHGVH